MYASNESLARTTVVQSALMYNSVEVSLSSKSLIFVAPNDMHNSVLCTSKSANLQISAIISASHSNKLFVIVRL